MDLNPEEQKIDQIISIYLKQFTYIKCDEIPKYSVKITDDIFHERLLLCNRQEESKALESLDTKWNQNATTVFPDDIDPLYYIIISSKRFNKDNDYIKSLCHEFTHVIDYNEYKLKYNIMDMRKIPKENDYMSYSLLSEFNARYKSFIVYLMIENLQYTTDSYEVLCSQYESLMYKCFNSCDYKSALYYLCQFLGQQESLRTYFSVDVPTPDFVNKLKLKKICDEIISVKWLESLFGKTNNLNCEIKKRFPNEHLIVP